MGDGGQRRDREQVALAFDDVGKRDPEGAPHAEQVDLEDPFERLRDHEANEAGGGDARVGDHDVDAAEVVDDAVDRGLQGLPVGDVGLPGRAAGPMRRPPPLFLGLESHKGDLRAVGGESFREPRADTPGRARDEPTLFRTFLVVHQVGSERHRVLSSVAVLAGRPSNLLEVGYSAVGCSPGMFTPRSGVART